MDNKNMHHLEELRRFKLQAKDGEFGRVRDVLIEEGTWVARWLVADTGDWLLGKKVLISPLALGETNPDQKTLRVDMTREDIESSPHLSEDAPVSRSYEETYFNHYQWPCYWNGGMLWGSMSHPYTLQVPLNETEEPDLSEPSSTEEDKHPLRSSHELTKYRLVSEDQVLGYVEDVLLDAKDWSVRYFQFDTRKWFQGLTLHVSPEKIDRISWPEHSLHTHIPKNELDGVKQRAEQRGSSPEKDSFSETDAQVRALHGIPVDHSGS